MDNSKAGLLSSVADDKIRFSQVKMDRAGLSQIEVGLREAENGDEMIRRIIGNYDIGAKLRHLRLRKKIALVDLGKHTGLSASMLSRMMALRSPASTRPQVRIAASAIGVIAVSKEALS